MEVRQFIERRRAEEALRVREAELEVITDTTPLMLTRCSRELRYVYVNRAYANMLGLQPQDIIGKAIVEVIGTEGYESIRPHVEKVLKGQSVEYSQEVLFQSVGLRHLVATYRPDIASDGAVVGWVASIAKIPKKLCAGSQRLLNPRMTQSSEWI